MYARVTAFELDILRSPLKDALRLFEDRVLPELRIQPGYEGAYVLATPAGNGMLITLWRTESDAAEGVMSGFYDEQVAKFVTLLREPPGRDHYEVLFGDVAVHAA